MRCARVFALVASLVVAACGDDEPRTTVETTDSVSGSAQRVRGRLPQGRFELPTPNSGAPHLFITLPEGYSVRPTGSGTFDQFFIVESTDPSILDSTATTPGFLQVYVGEDPRPSVNDRRTFTRHAVIGGRPVVWREWTDQLSDRRSYYARELITRDFFRSLAESIANRNLCLHVYVAGADSVRVARLVRAAESLRMTP